MELGGSSNDPPKAGDGSTQPGGEFPGGQFGISPEPPRGRRPNTEPNPPGGTNDPFFLSQWYLGNIGQGLPSGAGGCPDPTPGTPYEDIDATNAWEITTGSSDVRIAVIDVSVWPHHEDLEGRFVDTCNFTGPCFPLCKFSGVCDYDCHCGFFPFNDPSPPIGTPFYAELVHGTAISGAIGALTNNQYQVAGIIQSVSLMGYRVRGLGPGNNDLYPPELGGAPCETNSIIHAMNRAVDPDPSVLNDGAKVINMSLEAPNDNAYNQCVSDRLLELQAEGVILTVPAGNFSLNHDGPGGNCPYCSPTQCQVDGCWSYPAKYDHDIQITVAATNQHAGLFVQSSYGSVSVDLGAPGENIRLIVPKSVNGTLISNPDGDCGSGTSVASPMVAGVIGLLYSHRPELYWRAAKNAVMHSVDLLPSLQGKTVTGGRLNAHGALQWIERADVDNDGGRADLRDWAGLANCWENAGSACGAEFDLDRSNTINLGDLCLFGSLSAWAEDWEIRGGSNDSGYLRQCDGTD